jgi:hypothetical protein
MENLDANPSYRARNELVGFLDACELPITDDGCFMAYKKIRANFTDVHTGTFDNSPGTTVKMNRRDVNEDPTQACSAGLHVCSYSYLSHFSGDRIVSVKVNPRDCVAVPRDYSAAKMRVCEYTVIAELDMSDAITADVLSAGPSVVTGFAPTKRPADYFSFSKSLEDIFCEFSADDVEWVIDHFSAQSAEFEYCVRDGGVENIRSTDVLFEVLLQYFTFTEIRNYLRKLFA